MWQEPGAEENYCSGGQEQPWGAAGDEGSAHRL